MAVRSKEFVGIAEGIKSHELSTKGKIEQLKGRISELSGQKRSLNGTISYLESAIAAAYEDTDEDGDPDYALIASLESQKASAEDDLESVEQDLDVTGGELSHSESELEGVLEEKAQTLFEIQERARKTSNNIALAGGMYGAYAGVGGSLQSSMQTSLSSLSQAAGILGGSIDTAGGGSSGGSSGSSSSATNGTTHSDISTSPLAAFSNGGSSGGVSSSVPTASKFSSTQTGRSTPGTMPNFHSGQKTINAQKPLNFNSEQQGNSYAVSVFGGVYSDKSNIELSDKISKFESTQQSSHLEQSMTDSSYNKLRQKGKYTMNTRKTVEHMRSQMSKAGQEYFDSALEAGGGIEGQKAHLQGAGEAMYMTSSSANRASGNFLTKEHPGTTPQERKTNLQLPPNNDANRVERVVSIKPTVVLSSIVQAQPQWAKQGGYSSQQGMRQIFTPNNSTNGAISTGIYKVLVDGHVNYRLSNEEITSVGKKVRTTFKSFFGKIKQYLARTSFGNVKLKMRALDGITSNDIDSSINITLAKVATTVIKKSFGNSISKEQYSNIIRKVKVLSEDEIRSHYPKVNVNAPCFYHNDTKEIIIKRSTGIPIVSLTSNYIHEILHGLSHSNSRVGVIEKNIESGCECFRHEALNEGITEYYTKKVIEADNSVELHHYTYRVAVEVAERLEKICGESALKDAFLHSGIENIRRDFDNAFSDKGAFNKFSDKLDDLHNLIYLSGKSLDDKRVQRIRSDLISTLNEYEKLKTDSSYRFKKSIKAEGDFSINQDLRRHLTDSESYKEELQKTIYDKGSER